MTSISIVILSAILFTPTLAALVALCIPNGRPDEIKKLALGASGLVLALTVLMLFGGDPVGFTVGEARMQHAFAIPWIPAFGIDYFLGVDGISFPLVTLTALISFLAVAASWKIDEHVKAYCVLLLLLETGMLGVFLALDFFLFYVFWEVMLLPMYFLIGLWGGPRREYAAIKFFLYTLFGGVLILIAILALYFSSDLKALDESQLVAARVIERDGTADDHARQIAAIHAQPGRVHTFNILALQQLGQHTNVFEDSLALGQTVGWWSFLLLFFGFAIKMPIVPLHTWLPDAHVEAPTPISMILAGVLLKMGGYGLLRICYPICPAAGRSLAWLVAGAGLLSMVYGALVALGQRDFKRLVAYSSVSHMGYVTLGIGAWSLAESAAYWEMGTSGAMFQMVAHGVVSPAMFFVVGVVYDRVHHRNLEHYGGLFGRMPVYSGLAMVIFFAAMGLPGLCGFWGEALVTLAAWPYHWWMAVVAAGVVILTAAYILWTIQRVYLGPEYRGPSAERLTPLERREFAILAPLVALSIALGVCPQLLFRYVTPTIDRQIKALVAAPHPAEMASGARGLAPDGALPAVAPANTIAP